MVSARHSFVVVVLSFLIKQAQSWGTGNSILAPKGAKVLTVGVIGGNQNYSKVKLVTNCC